MKLRDQVVCVELSNRLLDLEVRRPSQFYRDWRGAKDDEILMWEDTDGDVCLDNVNCYSSAELGEMLPRQLEHNGAIHDLRIVRSTVWQFHYGDIHFTAGNEDTEADARAKMLIYLLDNNLMEKP